MAAFVGLGWLATDWLALGRHAGIAVGSGSGTKTETPSPHGPNANKQA